MDNKRQLGTLYEERAATFLQEKGLTILKRNFRCKSGEIDLIAREKNTIVFVEVKYRGNWREESAAAAVDMKKQIMISKVAKYYLYTQIHSVEVPCRFDVIAFNGEEPDWFRNAFDYQEPKKF